MAAQPRWRSPHGILFTPAELQRSDRAVRAGRYTLRQALQEAAARQHAGWEVPVAVRMSARGLTDRGPGAAGVAALLERYRLPAGSLVLELSDSDPRMPLDELELRLAELRRAGVLVALDGFGSGYAAIAALRRLPVDVLCLDRGLVDGVLESARLRKITAGLLRIAADLELPSVADGVELPEQVDLLRGLGCTHGMGAAFAGPLDEHRLRRALARGSLPVADRTPSQPVIGPRPGVPCGRERDRFRSERAVQPVRIRSRIRHCAHIPRRPSHPLDTHTRAGGRSVPCAPEFSYLDSASADRGHDDPATTATRSPRLPHGTGGFLLHRHLSAKPPEASPDHPHRASDLSPRRDSR